VEQHECFTYQIKPDNVKVGFHEFFAGKIFSSRWLTESVAAGKYRPADDYFLVMNQSESARRLNISKKKKYTIIEGLRLYEIITNQKAGQTNSNQFWQKVFGQAILPERTADSMKNFWKKQASKTLEEFLIECIHEGTDFCFSYKDIPNPDFVKRFRTQYENEFVKL
jgi:hypothetical protein